MNYIESFLSDLILILGEMSPYLLLGFFFAGLLHVFIPHDKIQHYFGGSGLKSSFYAALLGVPLPLCSCGVIPTGISFYKNGASKSSTVSFLISTPQTGVDSILVTYSLLGLPFAIIRPIVAFITGVTGGFITSKAEPENKSSISESALWDATRMNLAKKIVELFRYGFVVFLQDISKWLVIGLLIAAVISASVPDQFFEHLNLSPVLQMAIILAVSVPMYICATASVPLAAILIMKGVSPGAALVLLMAGPATNAATITMIGKSLGRKSLVAYLASIIGGAVFFGLLVDYLLPSNWFALTNHIHNHQHHSNYLLPAVSSVVLVILIINGWLMKYWKKYPFYQNKTECFMPTKTIIVRGMTCNHCQANVENNLKKLDFIQNVKVDLPTGRVTIEGENVNLDAVKNTVENLGYNYRGEA